MTTVNPQVVPSDPTGEPYGPAYPQPTADSGNSAVAGVTEIAALDTDYAAGRGVAVICTSAGNVTFKFSDGVSLITVPVVVGYNQFPFSVTRVVSMTTTATATFFNLK
jgi:hypothetical protein